MTKKRKKKGKVNKIFKTLAEVMKTYFPNREFELVFKSDPKDIWDWNKKENKNE